jgi:hypothetical protein
MTTDLEENILLDEISWQQKSRVLWLKEGDKNTKYFHSVANSHRRNNAIRQLNINNVVSSDQEAIKSWISNFYQPLYLKMSASGPH